MPAGLQDILERRGVASGPRSVGQRVDYNTQTATFFGLSVGGGPAFPRLNLIGFYEFLNTVELLAVYLSSSMVDATVAQEVVALAKRSGPTINVNPTLGLGTPEIYLQHITLINSAITSTPANKSTGLAFDRNRVIINQGEQLALYGSDDIGAGDSIIALATVYYVPIVTRG